MKRYSIRPLELRMKLYENVLKLRGQGLTCRQIQQIIEKNFGERLPISTINYWIRGIKSPFNSRRRILSIEHLQPSTELAYIIGVVFGDGYAYKVMRRKKRRESIRIGLVAKDREFAEKFAHCLGAVLGRTPPNVRCYHYPQHGNKSPTYHVYIENKTLFQLLHGRKIDAVRQFIEHCEGCKAIFLRGLFDSEGYVSKKGDTLNIVNTNYELLQYTKRLLMDLGIEATGPHIHTKKNTLSYTLYVRTRSRLNFYQKIGFTIFRKQKRLKEYLKRRGLLN